MKHDCVGVQRRRATRYWQEKAYAGRLQLAANHGRALKRPLDFKEVLMNFINLSIVDTSNAAMRLTKTAAFAAALMSFAPAVVAGEPIEKKGTTPYVNFSAIDEH
jgi:hypothetical protein